MSSQRNFIRMRTAVGRLGIFLAMAIAASVVIAPRATGQTNQESVLPPSRPGLSAVQLPDISSLEPDVREHLTWAQNSLVAALKEPATADNRLAELYGLTGQIYQAYSLHVPARECYMNASRLAPKDFRWVYLLGKSYEREGNSPEAVKYLNAALQLRTDYLPLFVSLGNISLQLNRPDDAEANFKRALEINENSAAAHYGLGQIATSKRSYPDAVKYLERALALAPESNRLHYALAMAYRGLGKLEQAQAHLALSGTVGVRVSDSLVDGLQDLVKGARLHLIRGRTALEARRFSEAADAFRKAIAAQSDSIPAHVNLGAALSQTGDLPGAIAQFEEVLRLDRNHPDAHYNLGLLLGQLNRHEQALKHLQNAVTDGPSDLNARFLLGQTLLKLGRLDEAEKELSRLVEAAPSNEDALLDLVTILLRRKMYGQALEALEKGHERSPQNGRTTVTLAFLLVASPQYEKR
ncbi:MAG TPA: tetratricopeptide repeat protein, partial [Pyrinomonadaceae bacterium]|nr:tetratricopeptide repeat protein [Pyrinomonadaceae bacterium]